MIWEMYWRYLYRLRIEHNLGVIKESRDVASCHTRIGPH